MKDVQELVAISNEIGKSRELVQGGGGNSSVKLDNGNMAIKASGYTFSELTESSGIVLLDLNKMKDFTRSSSLVAEENETIYNKILSDSMSDISHPRPSMEAGMHIFLDKVVVHTHPVMINILNCMKNGKTIIDKLFSNQNLLWVNYKTPGYQLAIEIKKEVEKYKNINGKPPELIFLKNHGIVVSANDFERCKNITFNTSQKVYDFLKKEFQIENFPTLQIINKNGFYFSENNVIKNFVQHLDENKSLLSKFLIPDDAIYCSKISIKDDVNDLDKEKINFVKNVGVFYPWNEKKARNIDEILTAKLYILMSLKPEEIDFLHSKDVEYLLNMESEKYRQKLNENQ